MLFSYFHRKNVFMDIDNLQHPYRDYSDLSSLIVSGLMHSMILLQMIILFNLFFSSI